MTDNRRMKDVLDAKNAEILAKDAEIRALKAQLAAWQIPQRKRSKSMLLLKSEDEDRESQNEVRLTYWAFRETILVGCLLIVVMMHSIGRAAYSFGLWEPY